MNNNTKEKILETSLNLFSENGFCGTSMNDIASAIGISKSALYKHFESKEEIWDNVREMITAYYSEHFVTADNLPQIPQSTDELYELTLRLVNFTVHDERVIKTRKILQMEQFRNEQAKMLASIHFLYSTEAYFTKIFEGMMANGILQKTDADTLAFSYTAPITALVHLCDREPEKEPEAMAKLKSFVTYFISVNKIK